MSFKRCTVALAGALMSVVAMANDRPSVDAILAMPYEARRAEIAKLSREELGELLRTMPTDALIALGKKSAEQLGTYRARLTKQERVKGEMLAPQIIDIVVREKPHAARLHYVGGPSKGRKVVYDESKRKADLRVREAGMLGIAGAVWIAIDSALTKRDSNRRVTDIGFGPMLSLLEKEFVAARPQGGFSRTDEGWDKRGRWCVVFDAPKGAKGLVATKARICFDPSLGVPVDITGWDAGGLLEKYQFEDVTTVEGADFSSP